jgi:uncharacterized protein (DUF2147 family)
MRLRKSELLLLALLGSAAAAEIATGQPANQGQLSPTGRWLTESGNLEVGVAPCGSALCGTVVREVANQAMSQISQPASDAAAAGSALGLVILQDFKPSGDDEWQGHIFNRENGQTYSCIMRLAAADTLSIRPYKFIRLFGKTQLWHRVQDQTTQQ